MRAPGRVRRAVSTISRQVAPPIRKTSVSTPFASCCPVDALSVLRRVLVAGDDGERRGHPAVGDGDAGVGGHGDGRGDAGHDLERDAGRASASASSPPRPKTKGSPPLSRTTRLALARLRDEQVVDLLLGQAVAAGRPCRRRCAPPRAAPGRASAAVDQAVVDDHLGAGQARRRPRP